MSYIKYAAQEYDRIQWRRDMQWNELQHDLCSELEDLIEDYSEGVYENDTDTFLSLCEGIRSRARNLEADYGYLSDGFSDLCDTFHDASGIWLN